MFALRWVLMPLLCGVCLGSALEAQEEAGAAISRAIDHENAGRYRSAIAAWREVVDVGGMIPGVLGLERSYAMLGEEQELLPFLDSLLQRSPVDPQLRSVQLRTLVALGRDASARAAFVTWRDARPTDAVPYRDFARVLLYHGRTATVDSVLQEAMQRLGETRALLLEFAQLRAALGEWGAAAEAWRETMRENPYFESAAVYSLTPAPLEFRDAIRGALTVADTPIGARQALASLELGWGAPRDGWRVLRELPPTDTTVAVWFAFAEEAERAQAWGAAADAFGGVYRVRRRAGDAERGATAALKANDPEGALTLVRAARRPGVPVRMETLTLEVDALTRLGRAAEAEEVVRRAGLAPGATRQFARTIAWGWIRAGNVAKAREVLADAPVDAEDAVAGWLALYDGDLAAARRGLRGGDLTGADAVTALALLSRTAATTSPRVGRAFLLMAQGDSVGAAAAFIAAATELRDAAPMLLTLAARLHHEGGRDREAVQLWRRVTEEFAASPEAAESRLEWGRALHRRGDTAGAREQYETLIIEHAGSALVPQARRERDALAGARGGAR